jgi:sulfate transport system ATP-binding protein
MFYGANIGANSSKDSINSMSHRIQLRQIAKRFGRATVLEDVSLDIDPGCIVGLLGQSGSGKTTLLRILAGLESPDFGEAAFPDAQGMPRVGMVFQQLGLWPHLTASQHLECVMSRQPRRQRAAEAKRLLGEVGLAERLHHQHPSRLSGGEAQRLALARALAHEPEVLLLDEPLAHLDAPLRQELLELIRGAIVHRGITALYVTHSASEAAGIATQLAVLQQGRIAQHGAIETLYWQPLNADVARLTGGLVALHRTWLEHLYIGGGCDAALLIQGEAVLVRPQQVSIVGASGPNCWCVERSVPLDQLWRAQLRHASGVICELPVREPLGVGRQVGIAILPTRDLGAAATP